MSNLQERNLDYLAAKHAQKIIEQTKGEKSSDVENALMKTLGVLQENGVYACFLHLLANENKIGKSAVKEMLALLQELQFPSPPESDSDKGVLAYIAEHVTRDLPRLLLAKEVLEQMLIYARYGAAARA